MNKQVADFIQKTTEEKILEWRTCEWSGEQFPIFERDKELLEQMSIEVGGKKFPLPLPKKAFQYRQFNRMLFRNERKLYRRKCSMTDASIISIYTPEYTGNVCTQDFWWSEDWDPLTYGQDFDFSKSFNEQFKILYDVVPKMATSIQESENCTFTNST